MHKTIFLERTLHSPCPRRPAAKVLGQKMRLGWGVMPKVLFLQSDGWEDRKPSTYNNLLNKIRKISQQLSIGAPLRLLCNLPGTQNSISCAPMPAGDGAVALGPRGLAPPTALTAASLGPYSVVGNQLSTSAFSFCLGALCTYWCYVCAPIWGQFRVRVG